MPPNGKEEAAPQTVAVIDIGSNAVRLNVAEVHPDDRTEVLERAVRPVRLGHDTFVDGRLSQDTMAATVTVLRDYRRILETYGVETVRAVATTAVREAANRDAFLDRLSLTVGFDVDVIETTEQSRLMVEAVRHAVEGTALDLKRGVALVAEVGGGSGLLTVLHGGEIAASQSFNLGSIRMQEMLATAQEPPPKAADLLRHHIANTVTLADKSLDLCEAETFVAIGGDARFAAHRVGEPLTSAELHRVEAAALDALVERCIPFGPEELAREHGLPYADAETLVPALLVYQALLHATRARQMIVSEVSMRDGLLLDLPRYLVGQQDPALRESILLSAKTIGEKYRYDEAHSEHVSELAVWLFDQLQAEHGLKPRHRLLLRVAGLLHEVGVFVSNRAHHKHSYYLISNAEIFGLRRDEMAVVAHVARYHRRSMPKMSHTEYTALPRAQRMVVNKLAAILRVADCLDRGHMQQSQDLELDRREHELVIYVRGATDLTLERRAIAEKGDLFEEMFGMRVHLEEGSPVAGAPGQGPAA